MIQKLKGQLKPIINKIYDFDFGVELGGVMINPLFIDVLILNFFGGGRGYSFFHISYAKGTGIFGIDYLFFFKYRSNK